MNARFHFKNGPFAHQEIELRPGTYRVGRRADNDLAIEDPTLSGLHCRIEVSGMGVVVEDLNSTNGCFLNRERFQKESLPNGCILKLGDVEISVSIPEVVIAVPDMTPAVPPPPNLLEDGSPACRHHPGVPATNACNKCGKTWCPDCVRQVGLAGGKNLLRFCASCDGKCDPIKSEDLKGTSWRLLGQLADTILMRRK
ncbi:MAG: FHA domain-containing protein [Verrucomicrobia bacterium]|nr:FHA domain-containing protein [Verrucomicrobiota bacterium]